MCIEFVCCNFCKRKQQGPWDRTLMDDDLTEFCLKPEIISTQWNRAYPQDEDDS